MVPDSETREQQLRHALRTFGDALDMPAWTHRDPDYVSALELTDDDVPTLLAVIREDAHAAQAGEAVEQSDPDDTAGNADFASVHAWRALAQMGATRAIHDLIAVTDIMEEIHDDWFLDEFEDVAGLMGPATLPSLQSALADPEHYQSSRIAFAHAVKRVGEWHADARNQAVSVLYGQMGRYAENPRGLNAFLFSCLMALRANEAFEIVENAFAEDHIDLSVCGNWNAVKHRHGIEERGLVPPPLADYRWNLWTEGKRQPGSWKPAKPPIDRKRRHRAARKRERKNRRQRRR